MADEQWQTSGFQQNVTKWLSESGEAAFLIIIPPVFDGATGAEPLAAIGQAQRTKAHLFQGHRKWKTLAQEVLDLGDEGKTLESDGLRVRKMSFFFHEGWCSAPKTSGEENPFVGLVRSAPAHRSPRKKAARCRSLRGRSQTGV